MPTPFPHFVARRSVRISAIGLLAVNLASAGDWPQWRGPQRNGTTAETDLLAAWPASGPPLRWQRTDLGFGYGSPAVVSERLYLLANTDLDNESVLALATADGRTHWSTRLGRVGNPKQNPNFPAARSTPTVDGDRLFALGSDGDLACLDAATGQVRWHKQLRTDFAGKPGEWAYAESPLVDGDTLVVTPGGAQATLVALNKHTGEVRWRATLPEADEAAYASAIVVELGGVRQYVQLLQKGLVGVDARSGRVLWRYAKPVSRYNANIPTPLAGADLIYAASAGTGGGTVRLRPAGDGVTFEELYFEAKLPTAIGGSVLVGPHLYGTTAQALLCVEFASGRIVWEERALGAAALCFADGRLYLHGENGEVALVEPSPEGYRERGRFSPPGRPKRSSPMEKSWAHPVVANGHLYLRDHGSLWCYDVRAR